MPTKGILHTCVLAVAISGMLHHKSKVTLYLHLDANYWIIDCECIKFLSVELRVSVRLLQHLHSNWDILFLHYSYWELWAVLLLRPLISPGCLLALLTAQTLRWSPLSIGQMVIILSFFWLRGIGLICYFAG